MRPSARHPAPSGAATAAPRFTDVTAESGLAFTTTFGAVPSTQILEVKGGGLALIDWDEDGDLDVFVPNGATLATPTRGPGCRLFENLGGLRFRDATEAAGLTFARWGVGAAVGDFDGDGHADLYVTCYGPNALLRNTGDGRFEEVAGAAGAAGDAWSVAAAFGDLDADGDLDLYVANYLEFDVAHPPPPSTFKGAPVFKGPRGLEPARDAVYENLGDGTFRDITEESGCGAVAPGFGLGVVILDFDGDGRQDIFVGNDSTPNFLFHNRGSAAPGGREPTFEDVGMRSGVAVNSYGSPQATMGIALGDVNGDGLPDLFTSNFSNDSNTLHVSKPRGFFDDATSRYGVGMLATPYVGWATAFHDFDLDGDEDLVVFNGHVYPNATCVVMDAEYAEPALLFAREGARFRRVTADESGPWLAAAHCDRGAGFGDLDGDGDVDVVVVELNGPVRVLRNDSDAERWLSVALEPTALGSRVELTVDGARQTRWIHSGGSFASASAQVAYFGLPEGHGPLEVSVTWPDGARQALEGVAPAQHLTVRRAGPAPRDH
ncbi:MAG: CRTAC1 family protein [Planctomycetota bacterium]